MLDVGALSAFAVMDVHTAGEEPGSGAARTLRPFSEGLGWGGDIADFLGTTVQNYDIFVTTHHSEFVRKAVLHMGSI